MSEGEIHAGSDHELDLSSRRRFLRFAAAAGIGIAAAGPLAACAASPSSGSGGGPKKSLKAAWVMNGPINDGSWEASHEEARQAVAKIPNVTTSYVDNVAFGDSARQTLMRMAARNDILFLTTDFADAQRQAAEANPDTKFVVAGTRQSLPNLVGFYVRNWQVSYILGVAAAKLTKSNKLGYVASFPVPQVYADVNGLALGAQSVNPDIEVQVVSINSWYDPQAATQAVDALVSGGADFVWGIMGDNSVPQAGEKRGVWSAAASRDARKVAPNGYVSTTQFDWAPFCVEQAKAVMDGTWKTLPEPGHLLALGEGIDRGKWGDKVPAEVRKTADAARAKILSGELNPFVGPLTDSKGKVRVPDGSELNQKQLATWSWPVKGVSGLKAG